MPNENEISAIGERFPHLADLPPTPSDPTIGTPPRRPGSVRRTATIDMVWTNGFGTPLQLIGRSRDLLTRVSGEAEVRGAASMRARVDSTRTIVSIETTPERPTEGLIGAKGGAELRGAIDAALPGEREAATPLHVLLDDIAGTSLIAGFALVRAAPELRERMAAQRRKSGAAPFGTRKGKIICSGLRPDGWADTHWKHEMPPSNGIVPATDVRSDSDPLGWHEFPPDPDVGMRRHRRIDVWKADDRLHVDAFFRDAAREPDGSQVALHEYSVSAEVDPAHATLVTVEATPRVLPYPECRWAAPHAEQLVGMPVSRFRTDVQLTLRELRACTHLNDMLRCLAEVPALAAHRRDG